MVRYAADSQKVARVSSGPTRANGAQNEGRRRRLKGSGEAGRRARRCGSCRSAGHCSSRSHNRPTFASGTFASSYFGRSGFVSRRGTSRRNRGRFASQRRISRDYVNQETPRAARVTTRGRRGSTARDRSGVPAPAPPAHASPSVSPNRYVLHSTSVLRTQMRLMREAYREMLKELRRRDAV